MWQRRSGSGSGGGGGGDGAPTVSGGGGDDIYRLARTAVAHAESLASVSFSRRRRRR